MVGHGRARLSGSSDPKPREGTETGRRIAPGAGGAAVVRPKTPRGDGNPTMASKSAWVTDPGRQTQNPERGRKPEIQHHIRSCGMLPKSSDPKPREGTETRKRSTSLTILFSRRQTQNPERGRKREEPSHLGLPPAGRQTQNPERGRKPVRHLCLIQVQCPVVRPKTTRGDGNLNRPSRGVSAVPESSDPKPREGTETQ
ncbi:Uncharacterised protein [Mycobacterium tuberculosis]|nr:Uncharacterised protein [Mycobacterium tuberculosis]